MNPDQARVSQHPRDEQTQEDDREPQTSPRSTERRRQADTSRGPTLDRTLAQRLVLPVVLVVAVIAFLSLPAGFPLHPWLTRLEPQPAATATPTLPLRTRQIYLDTAVPGMLVSVDGHKSRVPAIGRAAPVTLSPGIHHLTWGTLPFQSQSCELTIPASAMDSCDLLSSTASFSGGPPVPVVELEESLDTLPAAQQTALLHASQVALNTLPSTTVQPGEIYATTAGPQVATATFQASLTFQLQPELGTSCSMDVLVGTASVCQLTTGQDCARFCSLAWPSVQAVRRASGAAGWLVLAVVSLSWTYRSPDGTLIASNQPLDWQGNAGLSNHLVMLSVTWEKTGWQVASVLGDHTGGILRASDGTTVGDDPGCAQAQDLLHYLRFDESSGPPASTVHLADSTNPSAGCLVVIGSAVYLVRLGIVLATNGAAVTLGDYESPVPILTDNEMRLVAELRALQGQTVSLS